MTEPVAAGSASTIDCGAPALPERADPSSIALAAAVGQPDATAVPAGGIAPDDCKATAADPDGGTSTNAGAASLDSSAAALPADRTGPAAEARRSASAPAGDESPPADLPSNDTGAAGGSTGLNAVDTAGRTRHPSGAADVGPGPIAVAPMVTTIPAGQAAGAAPATTTPAATTVAAADAVRFLRELGPARAVQRLAVDLDGAMVAVRVDHTGANPAVRVQVVDDPAGRLGGSWATSVERTLTQTMQRDHSGSDADQRRHHRSPTTPDDAQPTGASGRRWARALGGER